MPTEFDPRKEESEQTLKQIEDYLKIPITNRPKDWLNDQCKHMRVELDEENKAVTCKDCKKVLDPFWYLQLLAREWSYRRYCDAEAIKAYRDLEQQRKNAKARGLYYIRPNSSDGMLCWDSYEALYGHPPEFVYYRGSWYAGFNNGEESFDYIKMSLAQKQRNIK